MVFSSIIFIYYFLPMLLIAYYIFPRKCRNIILLIFSLVFYFYEEKNIILVISCIANYFLGMLIEKNKSKLYITLGIVGNIAILGYYKYSNFFIENINSLTNANIPYLNIILPLGISFFTFQNLSYIIDVYRGEIKPQKSILKYATYITFFPQLIAGPIVRYKDVDKELEDRKENFNDFAIGVKRFIIGLSKKVLIANTVGNMCVILSNMANKTILSHILEAIGYTVQLYFDFSGYSDMAIGLALFFGFHFKENFNYPLIATSITDFWRRWHISLSSFFRDYVYIPLGGNKVKLIKLVRNIFIVWTLTGFWHGASWNFILWGIYFFMFLLLEKLFLSKYLKNNVISHIYTLIIVICSFVIFNMPNLASIGEYFKNMFGISGLQFANKETLYYLKNYIIILAISCIVATPAIKITVEKMKHKKIFNETINVLEPICLLSLLIVCTASLLSNSFNPFIYFRF